MLILITLLLDMGCISNGDDDLDNDVPASDFGKIQVYFDKQAYVDMIVLEVVVRAEVDKDETYLNSLHRGKHTNTIKSVKKYHTFDDTFPTDWVVFAPNWHDCDIENVEASKKPKKEPTRKYGLIHCTTNPGWFDPRSELNEVLVYTSKTAYNAALIDFFNEYLNEERR